jgi:hypothetical protein
VRVSVGVKTRNLNLNFLSPTSRRKTSNSANNKMDMDREIFSQACKRKVIAKDMLNTLISLQSYDGNRV